MSIGLTRFGGELSEKRGKWWKRAEIARSADSEGAGGCIGNLIGWMESAEKCGQNAPKAMGARSQGDKI
jgi:hypothetical protein